MIFDQFTHSCLGKLLRYVTHLLPMYMYRYEGVYVTIGNPAFSLFLYLTGVHLRGKLQDGGDASQQKIKCRPIRTRGTGGASLSDVLYV